MINVVPLTTVEPDKELIELCQELLDAATSGDMVELVCVYKSRDGSRNHILSATDDMVGEIGAVTRLLHILNTDMDGVQND